MLMTPKRAKFVREYLKDGNATQAAIRAGYPPKGAKQQGSRLLSFVDVQEQIARLQDASARIELSAELKPREQAFVREYLKDSNGKQAAIRAGYPGGASAEVTSSRLLRNAKVLAALEDAQRRMATRLEVSAERVLKQYAKTAFANITDICEWGPAGVKWKPSAALDEADAAAVLEVCEVSPKEAGKKTKGKRQAATKARLKIKLRDSTRALDSLSKHLGLFRETSVDVDQVEALLAILPPDLARAIRAAIEAQVVAARYGQSGPSASEPPVPRRAPPDVPG
jgi:phage terminase small subunit